MSWHFSMKGILVVLFFELSIGSVAAQEKNNTSEGLLARLQSAEAQLAAQQQLLRSLEERFVNYSIAQKALIDGFISRTPKLDCQSVHAVGRRAACPSGFLATGCAAGYNKGSHSIQDAHTACVTNEDVDWTVAHCCRAMW